MAWAQLNSIRKTVNLPTTPGYTLQPGYMYVVNATSGQTVNINASSGNGLNVKTKTGDQQAPILYIPEGVTLNVTGAAGNGMTGGGAGIYVPKNAELIITGAGTLNATGGAAGNGGNGLGGNNGGNRNDITEDWKVYNDRNECSGAGGRGGNGGGGAGAGIGGIGGQGGQGGAGGEARYFSKDTQQNGDTGHDGGKGNAGSGMGKVSIMGAVTVNATSGAAGSQGNGGLQGWTARHREGGAWYVAGAGGAGGGGGAGLAGPTSGFGAGAPGAGGGAGGGSGAVDYVIVWDLPSDGNRRDNWSNRASSGAGGIGSTNGTDGSNDRGRDTGSGGTIVFTAMPRQGGVGGNGGAQGAKAIGDDGYVYVANGATVNGKTGSATSNKPENFSGDKGTEPTDMKITITFVNNEYDATAGSTDVNKGATVHAVDINIGDPLPGAAISTYKLSAKAKTATQEDPEEFAAADKYFAGYYTADKGRGTRVYKGIGTTNLDIVSGALPYIAGDITLYAHFTHVHHVINWDYTYSTGVDGTGTSTWANLNYTEFLNHGKLVFYKRNASGERVFIKEVVMQAHYETSGEGEGKHAVDDPEHNFIFITNPLAGLNNHTRAQGKIYLTTASGDDYLESDQNIVVHFTDEELVQFMDYEFIPWDNNESQKATNWETIVDTYNHQTVFSFTGAKGTNQYTQTWTVKLTGLKVYPDRIFAKPLYKNSESNWALISQLPEKYDGIVSIGRALKNGSNEVIGYEYTGEYPVWNTDNHATPQEYKYKVGLVGFYLNGEKYYMDPNHGAVTQSDMQSLDTHEDQTTQDKNNIGQAFLDGEGHAHPIDIKMTVPSTMIPVLRLMPNGGQLGDHTPAIVVNETRTGNFDLSQYTATKEGYKLLKWTVNEDGTGDSYAPDCTTVPGTGAITLYAQWQETTPPTINTHHIDYKAEGATIYVSVTDNVGVSSVKYIVSESAVADLEHASWEDATPGVSPLYSFDALSSKVNNKSFAYIYVKATDAAGNETIMSAKNLKIDGINPTYEIYPLGNVCNFKVEITAKDNIQIEKIEYVKTTTELTDVTADSQEWTTVSSFTKDTNTEKAFTIAKLNGEEQKTCNAEETTHTPKIVSLRITDAAGNVTQYLNHTNMYYDHVWDTSNKHSAIYVDESGNYNTVHYYTCKHGCDHIWAVEVIGGEPYGDGGLYNRDSGTEHYQQGLMRDETSRFINASGSVLINDKDGMHVDIAQTINAAITTINSKPAENAPYTIILVDDANVGEASASEISTPSVNVTIDLNASGLLVNGQPGTITGKTNVTILLTDNGALDYANKSTVTGSPIKYVRTFSKMQAAVWQGIFLPFSVASVAENVKPAGADFGTLTSVKIDTEKNETTLNINKDVEELTYGTPYFIRMNKSVLTEMTITASASTTLQPWSSDMVAAKAITDSDDNETDYTIGGSLIYGDQTSRESSTSYAGAGRFWTLTNGGHFNHTAVGAKQRPYRWVIYDSSWNGSSPAPTSIMLFVIGEDEDPTAINVVEVEAADSNAPIYTISGTRVSNESTLAPGIYIRGGKKFIVR